MFDYINPLCGVTERKIIYDRHQRRHIALRIKSIRELHGLTQIEFAKRLDVALPIIEAFESNRMVIDDRIINRVCDEFDLSSTK